jgi:hypothetical protein
MAIHATDGDLGHIEQFYFDDESWTVRYLIAKTGGWFSGARVLLPPAVVKAVDWTHHALVVSLSTAQVKDSPAIDTAKPVSRIQEEAYLRHYNLPLYWDPTGLGGGLMAPGLARADAARDEAAGVTPPTRLRSSTEVTGYQLEASDGPVGKLTDFILTDDSWRISYLVVGLDGGPEVVFPPEWVERINWGERRIHVAVEGNTIRLSPAYGAIMQLTPGYDAELERHYGRRRVRK